MWFYQHKGTLLKSKRQTVLSILNGTLFCIGITIVSFSAFHSLGLAANSLVVCSWDVGLGQRASNRNQG
jgi:hypothetical protein